MGRWEDDTPLAVTALLRLLIAHAGRCRAVLASNETKEWSEEQS